jgi:hypothetical protein
MLEFKGPLATRFPVNFAPLALRTRVGLRASGSAFTVQEGNPLHPLGLAAPRRRWPGGLLPSGLRAVKF